MDEELRPELAPTPPPHQGCLLRSVHIFRFYQVPAELDTSGAFSQTLNTATSMTPKSGSDPHSAGEAGELAQGPAKVARPGSRATLHFPSPLGAKGVLHPRKKARHYPKKCYLYIKRTKRFCDYSTICNLSRPTRLCRT